MTHTASIEPHPHWGRTIARYPRFHHIDLILAHIEEQVDETEREHLRRTALSTIEDIFMLGDPNLDACASQDLFARITLERIEAVIEFARFPQELENLPVPRLVYGCIRLILSTGAQPFYYEYGYLCLKLMAIALNSCLLNYGFQTEIPIRVRHIESPNNSLSVHWVGSASLIVAELTGEATRVFGRPLSAPIGPQVMHHFDTSMLDELLSILYRDQKNLTIALKGTRSLGLSGVLYSLWKFVESKRTDIEADIYEERYLMPYISILYRYRLLVADFYLEREATSLIFDLVSSTRPRCDSFIDLEDSIQVIEAYIDCLWSQGCPRYTHCGYLATFVTSLVVPGCEDLIPDMFKVSMEVLWNSLANPQLEPNGLIITLGILMQLFFTVLDKFQPLSVNLQPWASRLVDNILNCDAMAFILRVTGINLSWEDADEQGRELDHTHLMNTVYLSTALMTCIPKEDLIHQLRVSGGLREWRKYLLHFGSQILFDSPGTVLTATRACTVVVIVFWEKVFGDQWMHELPTQPSICNNPRCPLPFEAELANCQDPDIYYCSSRCQTFEWLCFSHRPGVDPEAPVNYVSQT